MQVNIYDHASDRLIENVKFNVRHIRDIDNSVRGKKTKASNGGVTILSFQGIDNPSHNLQWAKCRNDERFSRKHGILVALAKFVRKRYGKQIVDFAFPTGSAFITYDISVSDIKGDQPYWFLPGVNNIQEEKQEENV